MSKFKLPNINTPYYVINEEKLRKNFYNMKSSFGKNFRNLIIGYSFKTNSLPWILNWMKEHGAYAEVVSKEEYELALCVGFSDSTIIFNGPVKERNVLKRALLSGAIVNLDSFEEIEYILNSIQVEETIRIGLRVNFDLESYCPGETIMGDEPGRFGFNIENGSLERAINILKKYKNIKVEGIHLHNSTKTKSLKVFDAIVEKAIEASRKIGNKLKYIDIGGCFYGDKPGAPSFVEYADTLSKLNEYFDNDVKIILEPGAALIASPVEFICKVVDVKEVKNRKIITTDGSCHNINPTMSGVKFYIESDSTSKISIKNQVVCGYTCIEKDRMAYLNDFPELKKDNIIKFYNVGAYSMALQPLFINYYPAVVVLKNGQFYYARMPWGINEYMAKCFINEQKEV